MSQPRRNRAWIWIFVLLPIASVAVAVGMIQYNLSLQLKPQQLEAARARWQEKGPRDYVMVYTKRINDEQRVERFVVKVRDGQVREVLLNGMPLEKQNLPYHSMERLYGYIAEFLDRDQKPGMPRTYARLDFDEKTGALQRYVRRVMGTQQRVEITVELKE